MSTSTTNMLARVVFGALLFLALGATVATGQQTGEPQATNTEIPEEPVPAPAVALTKICEGKWTSAGEEHVVSQVCTSVRETCTCTADKVKCGGENSAPAGSTFVEGSCTTRWVSEAASADQLDLFLDDFLRVLFEAQ